MIKKLDDGTQWIKATYWTGEELQGIWEVTYKIDGIRAIRGVDGNYYSRSSKPVLHTELATLTDMEIFLGDWNTTSSRVNTKDGEPIPPQFFYSLAPIDKRLFVGTVSNPTSESIQEMLKTALNQGYEGLVLRKANKWLKVVPEKHIDIKILDIVEGKGKYSGVAGSIDTKLGNVGSFALQPEMTDLEFRKELLVNKEKYLGMVIEVGYREYTSKGCLRFPKLLRLRPDKNYEDPINETPHRGD